MLDNYLAELVKGRNVLLAEVVELEMTYYNDREKLAEIEKHVDKIDNLIDQVMVKKRPKKGNSK